MASVSKKYHWITTTTIWLVLLTGIVAFYMAAMFIFESIKDGSAFKVNSFEDFAGWVMIVSLVAYGLSLIVGMIYLLQKKKRGLDFSLSNTVFMFMIFFLWWLSNPGLNEHLLWPSLFAGIVVLVEFVLLLSFYAGNDSAYEVLGVTNKKLYQRTTIWFAYWVALMWLLILIGCCGKYTNDPLVSLALCLPIFIGCILISCKQLKAGYITYAVSLLASILAFVFR